MIQRIPWAHKLSSPDLFRKLETRVGFEIVKFKKIFIENRMKYKVDNKYVKIN